MTFNWVNNANVSAAGTTFTITKGANTITDGDLLIASVNCQVNTTISAPTGWTQVPSANAFDGDEKWSVWYKVAAGESGSYNFTIGASSEGSWALIDYGGLTGTLDASAVNNDTGFNATHTLPSVSPTGSADLWIGIGICKGGDSPYSNSGFTTVRLSSSTASSAQPQITIGEKQLAASGATGSFASVTEANANNGAGISMAWFPAGATNPAQYLQSLSSIGRKVIVIGAG